MGLHDRLGDEGRDQLGPFVLDLLLKVVGAIIAIVLVRHAERIAIAERRRDERNARHAGLGDVTRTEPIGHRERSHGRPVVGVASADDLVGARLGAATDVVLLGEFKRGLHRLGAAHHEQRLGEIAGRELGQFLSQPDGRLAEVADGADVVEVGELGVDGVGDLLVAVALGVGARVRAHHVEVGLAGDVGELDALALGVDIGAVLVHLAGLDQRKDAVIERGLGQFVDVGERGAFGHDVFLPCFPGL